MKRYAELIRIESIRSKDKKLYDNKLKGYTMVAKEFDECLRKIVQLNYGLVLISHAVDKTFTDEAGHEYNQIVPTLGNKPRNIVARMCKKIA